MKVTGESRTERIHQGIPGGLKLTDLTLFTSTTPFLQLVLSGKINDPWAQAQWVVSINLAELGDVSGCILKGHALFSRSLTCQLSFVHRSLHIDSSWRNMSSIACCPIFQHVSDGNTLSCWKVEVRNEPAEQARRERETLSAWWTLHCLQTGQESLHLREAVVSS